MRFLKKNYKLIILVLCTTGCNYDIKRVSPATVPIIDTLVNKCDTSEVTYLKTIKPLLVKNCYTCHTDTSTNPNRNTYAFFNDFNQLQTYATARSVTDPHYTTLQARIRHIESPGMPLSLPSLSECDIRKFEIWISKGAKNN